MKQQNTTEEQDFDKLAAALELAEPVIEAVKDIPAMLAVNARCVLAGHFMHPTEDGKTRFDVAGFEAAWKYISGETDENKTE